MKLTKWSVVGLLISNLNFFAVPGVAVEPSTEAADADKKILFFGNSITHHAPSQEVDWQHHWGMAASAQNKDYVHLVVDSLSKTSGHEYEFLIHNAVPFEVGYKNYEMKHLDDALQYNADIVVIALGENANSLTDPASKAAFEKKLNDVVSTFKQNHPETILIRSTFWAQKERDEILKRVAEKQGCTYVDISGLVYDESNYARSERKYKNEGVAMHPGDEGMKKIAQAILEGLSGEDAPAPSGEPVYELDLIDAKTRAALTGQGVEIVEQGPEGKPVVKIVSRAETGGSSIEASKIVSLPVNLSELKNGQVEISGRVRGENITKPAHVYTGVKVQLHVVMADGSQNWIDQGGSFGTFDWKALSARAGISGKIQSATLVLGMQESTGTVWISDVKIRAFPQAESLPAVEVKDVELQPAVSAPGASAYRLDFTDPEVRKALEGQGGEFVENGPGGKPALKITSATEPGGSSGEASKMLTLPFDVSKIKGCKIEVSGQVRGEDITKPMHVYTGVKVQLHVVMEDGQQNWIDQGGTFGTFDWKELSARAGIPQNVQSGTIALGLQESTGTVWISDVVIRILQKANVRPAPKDIDARTTLRGVMSPVDVNEQNYKDMGEWNINLVRWQLAGVKSELATYDAWFANKIVQTKKILDFAAANGIAVIIDLHFLPGGREENGDARLFYDKKLQEDFVGYWEQMVREVKGHPALYAYDFMNEPVQRRESPAGVDNWHDLQVRTAKAVREIDPDTLITFETDEWCNPNGYLTLEPLDLPGIIYQVHSYWPGGYTHQGIFTDQGIAKDVDSKESAVSYPGMIGGQYVDKEALRKSLQPVRDFQLAYDVPIYAGEFSVVRWAPGGAQFLDDLISIFEEYGWDWSYHAFREYGGWSVEHQNLPYDRDHHVKATAPTDRQKVLMKWFKLNEPYHGEMTGK